MTGAEKPKAASLRVKVAGTLVIPFIVVGALVLMIKTYDVFLGLTHTVSSLYPEEMQPIVFDWYPYSVGHMGADMVWDKEIRIGQMGYWYPDFDFNHPPKKAANEYRIVLIGGSGAQGQGATIPNEKMLYAQIEMRLNQYLGYTGKHFRVINMAMGGSRTYHNFVDLNQFGHRLQPDMILTYSGFNDWCLAMFFDFKPSLLSPKAPQDTTRSHPFMSLIGSALDLSFLRSLFPHLLAQGSDGMGMVLRQTFFAQSLFQPAGPHTYFASRRDFFERMVVPLYVGSLKSIKRDFPGIPLMIAWQAIEDHPDEFAPYGDPRATIGPNFYNDMFETAKTETMGYGTGGWLYQNIHRMYQDDPRLFGFHLTLEAQGIVGDAIAQRIALAFDPHYAEMHPDVATAIVDRTYRVERPHLPKIIPGAPSDWSEEAYLFANPDVAALVAAGKYSSGWEYYEKVGAAAGQFAGSPKTWNEQGYLAHNPDVAYFVRLGTYKCGYQHWVENGKREGRIGGVVP